MLLHNQPQRTFYFLQNGLTSRRRVLHHLCLLLLESLTDPLASCHKLLNAAGDTAGLTLDEGFGSEIVNAGVEAVGDEVGEHL